MSPLEAVRSAGPFRLVFFTVISLAISFTAVCVGRTVVIPFALSTEAKVDGVTYDSKVYMNLFAWKTVQEAYDQEEKIVRTIKSKNSIYPVLMEEFEYGPGNELIEGYKMVPRFPFGCLMSLYDESGRKVIDKEYGMFGEYKCMTIFQYQSDGDGKSTVKELDIGLSRITEIVVWDDEYSMLSFGLFEPQDSSAFSSIAFYDPVADSCERVQHYADFKIVSEDYYSDGLIVSRRLYYRNENESLVYDEYGANGEIVSSNVLVEDEDDFFPFGFDLMRSSEKTG